MNHPPTTRTEDALRAHWERLPARSYTGKIAAPPHIERSTFPLAHPPQAHRSRFRGRHPRPRLLPRTD